MLTRWIYRTGRLAGGTAILAVLAACGPSDKSSQSSAQKTATHAEKTSAAPLASPSAPIAPPSWPGFLPELLPAIDACLAAAAPQSLVTLAMPMNHGKALVRMLSPGDLRAECIADIGLGKVEDMTSLPAGAASLPGENNPQFLRAPGVDYSVEGASLPANRLPPGLLREMRGPDGVIWGWTVADLNVPPVRPGP